MSEKNGRKLSEPKAEPRSWPSTSTEREAVFALLAARNAIAQRLDVVAKEAAARLGVESPTGLRFDIQRGAWVEGA